MRNRRHFFALCLLLLPIAAAVPQGETEVDPDDNREDKAEETQGVEQKTETESPSMFVPKEKISPDQVISFPADI